MKTVMKRGFPCLGLLPLLAWGCAYPTTAVVNGAVVPRPTMEFTGQPYSVRHAHAHPQPGGPSGGLRSPGGTIDGEVCGAGISYEVYHRGDHVQLIGLIDAAHDQASHIDSQLRIEDQRGQRLITGNIGTKAVELHLRPDRIQGFVGTSTFGLRPDGDHLVGQVHRRKQSGQVVEVTVHGRQALWEMPAADQAAVVPFLLDCLYSDLRYQFQHDPPPLGFGGLATAYPRGTLLYRSR